MQSDKKRKLTKGGKCSKCGQHLEYTVELESHDLEVYCAFCDEFKGLILRRT